MNRYLFACVILLTFTTNSLGTTVAIVGNEKMVVIGADSLGRHVDFVSNGPRLTTFHHCKIHVANGTAFGFSGLDDNADAKLDVLQATTDVVSKGRDIRDSANTIANRIEGPLLVAIKLLYERLGHNAYTQYIGITPSVLSIGIVGMRGNRPSFVTVEFLSENDPTGAPIKLSRRLFTCPGDCPPNTRRFSLMGFNAAAAKLINGGSFWTGDLIADVRRILDIEIKDVPDFVGPPVDVLTLDSSGVHWIPPYGECHNQ